MRDVLRLAAHIAGIALTISLIPLAAALMLTDHPGWGAICLLAALGAVVFAARLDRRVHERRDPVDEHFADTARALHEPTMRLPFAPPGRRPSPRPPPLPPAEPWFLHNSEVHRD